jgi:MFS family permease
MALSWTLTAIIIVVILMGPSLLQSLFAVPAKTALIANAAGTLCLCLSTAALGFLSDRFGLRRVLGTRIAPLHRH